MTKTIQELRDDVERARQDLARTEAKVAAIQRACKHPWDKAPVVYDPIVTEGYRDPGDPPGTMGIDRRLPQWIEGSTTRRWRRTCPNCLLSQETKRTKPAVRRGPIQGTSMTVDEPVFD